MVIAPRLFNTSLVTVDRWLGTILTLFGLASLLMWWTARATDRHGMIFVFLGAVWLGPSGPLFFLAGSAVARRWRLRWVVQALPLLYPVAFLGALTAGWVP